MLTPFGKEIRKLRIDVGITLKTMADALGIESSYLSAIETGKKNSTDNFTAKVCNYFQHNFNLDEQSRQKLIDTSLQSRDVVSIPVNGRDQKQRELVASFARKFDSLTEDQVSQISNLLDQKIM